MSPAPEASKSSGRTAPIRRLRERLTARLLAVPVQLKIAGMVLLPVLILGITLNYFVRSSLSDWLSWLLKPEQVEAAMQAGGRSVLLVTLLAACASVLLSSWLMFLLTRPLLELKHTADQVRVGDLALRAPVRGRDEIGQVAESFNRMLDELLRIQHELKRSNRHLASIYHVSTQVGRGLELPSVLEAALGSTLDVAGLESGWIHLQEPETQRFYLASAVRPPAYVTGGPPLPDDGLCGCQQELLESDGWTRPSLRQCQRMTARDAEHPIQHLSVPLSARGMKLGVLNLLWTRPQLPDDEQLDLLEALGAQVSEAVANARLHADLREKEAGMEALLASLTTAQEDERALIAGELHDGAGQELTSILLRLKALEDQRDVDALRAGIVELCRAQSSAIEHIRTLSHQLRPPDLDQIGLGPSLHNLALEMLGQNGIEIAFDSQLNGRRLDPTTEITLYRIAQEALTNISRHAQANRAQLKLELRGRSVEFEVEDDGVGFDPDALVDAQQPHIGLASIQERATRLGGSFVIHTAPGQGTQLQVSIPNGRYGS